jgi:hypothetical protein
MSTPSSPRRRDLDAQVARYLFSIAGLTEQEAERLVRATGAAAPVAPELEDYQRVPPVPELTSIDYAYRRGDTPDAVIQRLHVTSPGAITRIRRAWHLARTYATIRVALGEQTWQREGGSRPRRQH